MKKLLYRKKLLLVLIFIAFWIKAAVSLDPDFGYRLVNGYSILESGIESIRKDPYSYTMPSYYFVEHSWLTAVFFAFTHSFIGYIGLAAVSAFFTLLAIVLALRNSNNLLVFYKGVANKDLWQIGHFPFLLVSAIFLTFIGIRAQVVSWILLSVIFYISFNEGVWKKWRIFLPLLFLLWVNLHASFSLGLVYLVFILVLKTIFPLNLTGIKSFIGDIWDRFNKRLFDYLLVAVSFFATLANPYGFKIWIKVFSVVTDNELQWVIAEWQPLFVKLIIPAYILITLSTILVIKYRNKIGIEKLLLYFLLLFQSFASVRHTPLWALIALPLTLEGLAYFYQEIKADKHAIERFNLTFKYAFKGTLIVLLLHLVISFNNAIKVSEKNFYPQKAVEYLKEHTPEGEIFSRYGWGGYLIWKYPQKKVFIDGRMPSWRRDVSPANETGSAMGDYHGILNGNVNYVDIFEKYKVDTVLAPKIERSTLANFIDEKLPGIRKLFNKDEENLDFLETLLNDGWEVVYEDEVSTIYQRPN